MFQHYPTLSNIPGRAVYPGRKENTMKKFDADSFDSRCPENWEEIVDYLNSKIGEESDDMEQIWEDYCSGRYPDAPEAQMEED